MQPIETAKSPAERAFELVKDAPLGVLLIDSDLRIREVNDTAHQILEQIPGTSGRGLREVAHLLEARGGVLCYLGGNERWDSAPPRVAELLPSAEREPAASSRARDDFLATVAHELRSPLTTISGFADILVGSRPIPDSLRTEALQVILRSSRRLSMLVEDLFSAALEDSGTLKLDLKEIDLLQLSHRAAAEFPDVSAEVSGESVNVVADEQRMLQVLVNLLANARRYGKPPVLIEVSRRSELAEVAVVDHGTGFQPQIVGRLFQKYATWGSAHGTGIGLWLVRRVIEAHDGSVEAHNRTEGGAEIRLRLPA